MLRPKMIAPPPPPPNAQERAEQALKEGIARIMRALELLIDSVPQYEAPEVLDNGDIIIRRKHPKPPEPKNAPHKDDPTKT